MEKLTYIIETFPCLIYMADVERWLPDLWKKKRIPDSAYQYLKRELQKTAGVRFIGERIIVHAKTAIFYKDGIEFELVCDLDYRTMHIVVLDYEKIDSIRQLAEEILCRNLDCV